MDRGAYSTMKMALRGRFQQRADEARERLMKQRDMGTKRALDLARTVLLNEKLVALVDAEGEVHA